MRTAAVGSSRFAIYYLPEPTTALHTSGSAWLGRDLEKGAPVRPDLPSAISIESWSEVTFSARRYGFHATLKPPFRLASGCQPETLWYSLKEFAAKQRAFRCAPLKVDQLGSFLALTLSQPCPDLANLADECVRQFESFRALPSAAEMLSRRQASLTPRELSNLDQWGYPYVFDTWKFHMTLTCSLPPEQRQDLLAYLQSRFAESCLEPLTVSSICLLEEAQSGAEFRLVERFPLAL